MAPWGLVALAALAACGRLPGRPRQGHDACFSTPLDSAGRRGLRLRDELQFENVSVIQTSDNTVVATVAVGVSPVGVAVTPDGAFAYVTNAVSNTVSVIRISDNTVVDTVAVGDFRSAWRLRPTGLSPT